MSVLPLDDLFSPSTTSVDENLYLADAGGAVTVERLREGADVVRGEVRAWMDARVADDAATPLAVGLRVEQRVRQLGVAIDVLAEQRAGVTAADIQTQWAAEVAWVEQRDRVVEDAVTAAMQESRVDERIALLEDETAAARSVPIATMFSPDSPNAPDHPAIAALRQAQAALDEAVEDSKTLRRDVRAAAIAAFTADNPPPAGLDPDAGTGVVLAGGSAGVTAMVGRVANTRRAVLAELRPLGGDIAVLDTSSARAGMVLNEAAGYFPSDWVEASNVVGSLRAKDTKARAHYASGAAQKFRANTWITAAKRATTDAAVRPDEVRGVFVTAASNGLRAGWFPPDDPRLTGVTTSASDPSEPDTVMWFRPAYQTKTIYASDLAKYTKQGWTAESAEATDSVRMRVKRQATRMVTGATVAEILIDADTTFQHQSTPGLSTALHEFSHRAEHVNPVIGELTAVFHVRRTTNTNGDRDPLVKVSDLVTRAVRKQEMGRVDSYAERYMGREYDVAVKVAYPLNVSADTPGRMVQARHAEVLSCGMEAVFGARYGALSGAGGRLPDADMRGFVLGLLAVA